MRDSEGMSTSVRAGSLPGTDPSLSAERSPTRDGARARTGRHWLDEKDEYWPAEVTVLCAMVLYAVLPTHLLLGPRWIVPVLEAVLLIAVRTSHVSASSPTPVRSGATAKQSVRSRIVVPWQSVQRLKSLPACVLLLSAVTLSNGVTLGLLTGRLVHHVDPKDGRQLLLAALAIWLTNILMFALWFWKIDRGGSTRLHERDEGEVDFRFPQMEDPESAWGRHWHPKFFDYLYLSFTNAIAFSPTDAMPLTYRSKTGMLVQSVISLLTVVLVTARAVNIEAPGVIVGDSGLVTGARFVG